MENSKNNVNIVAPLAELAETIDVARAQAAKSVQKTDWLLTAQTSIWIAQDSLSCVH